MRATEPAMRPLTDTATMLRRRLRHLWRYPSLTLMLVGQPIVFLLLFVYVFGATLGAGLAGPGGGRDEYLAYITPAILLMTVASVALATAIALATDMTEGIVARFRTMAVARVSLLSGHVLGAMLQTALALVVVLGVALLLGFRAQAGPPGWLAVVDTLRALLSATPVGSSAPLAVAWCVVITAGSHLAARRLFERRAPR